MKLSILSDFHFGYAPCAQLENDSFEHAEEAMEKALDSDLILLAGDLFDSRSPKPAVWAKALRVLVKPLLKHSGIKLVECGKELPEVVMRRSLQALPIVAIHGTHERVSSGEVNPLHILERAGLLIHLHCTHAVFEKDGQRVAIHGMSGVPDLHAARTLKEWNPKPLPNCFNVLLLHQSVRPFVWSPLDTVSLSLDDLPKGFDLIVLGHLHQHAVQKLNGTLILIPGSTLVTQLEQSEAEDRKGFYQVVMKGNKIEQLNFVQLERCRPFCFEELQAGSVQEVRERVRALLAQPFPKLPLIKLKVRGKHTEIVEEELKQLERECANAILHITTELEEPELSKKIEFLRKLRERKLSIDEIGLQVLLKNLAELGFKSSIEPERLFKLLCEHEPEEVMDVLLGKQTSLSSFK